MADEDETSDERGEILMIGCVEELRLVGLWVALMVGRAALTYSGIGRISYNRGT